MSNDSEFDPVAFFRQAHEDAVKNRALIPARVALRALAAESARGQATINAVWCRYWTHWYERHQQEAAESRRIAESYGATFAPSATPRREASDAALGRILMKYIDRLTDPVEGDSLAGIVMELDRDVHAHLATQQDAIRAARSATEDSEPHAKQDAWNAAIDAAVKACKQWYTADACANEVAKLRIKSAPVENRGEPT